MKKSQATEHVESALIKLGWHKNDNSVYASTPLLLLDNNVTWRAGFRSLYRHRYLGVTPDSAIRYRTNEGIRIKLTRPLVKPSRLLITTLATLNWLRWLLHHGLKYRGFKRYPQKLGKNTIYHQDTVLAEKLLTNEDVLKQSQLLANLPGVLRWELGLIPGKLTINLTLSNGYDMKGFSRVFDNVKQLAEAIQKTPHSKELSLTTAEQQQLSTPQNQLKKSTLIKGGLIVFGLLFLFTALLMGLLFGLAWLMT